MKKVVLSNSVKICMQFILLIAISCFNLGASNTNSVHASAPNSTDSCGQLLADAKAKFLSLLPADGSIPATSEVQAAAQEYIHISKLCYDQIQANNSPAMLQTGTPLYIDDGGMFADSNGPSANFKVYNANDKWSSSTITYSFMKSGISFSSESYGNSTAISQLPGFQPCFLTDIQSAFAAWQAVANVHFQQVTDDGSAFDTSGAVGDIRIAAHTFDGAYGTLAHAYFPPPSGASVPEAGDLHFDSAENWTCNTSGIDIGMVALHEIGHSLGLDHQSAPPTAVMNPTYNASLTGLQSDDISGIRNIYGPAILAAAPGNDNITNATTIPGISFTDPINIDGATIDNTADPLQDPDNIGPCTDSPSLHYNKIDKSVWYKYTPSVVESISVDTQGSNITINGVNRDLDTFLAVWTLSGSTFNLVKCNDDDLTGYTSSLSFVGSPSVTYYFEAGDYTCYYGSTCSRDTGGNLVFNVNITNTDVYIGANKQDSYYLYNTHTIVDRYPTVINGPVKAISSTGENIFASQRAISGNSLNEIMGYPANQFAKEYWFPWYDGVYMTTWVLVGNPSTSQTAYVDIYIGGQKQGATRSIPANGKITPKFTGIVDGPVRVVSTTGAGTPSPLNIFTSERSLYGSSFNEIMGYPSSQFEKEYWFPWYDGVSMTTWVLVGNPSASQTAYVDIYIGGQKQGATRPIPPNGNITPKFPGVVNGPVRVVSTTGSGTLSPINIFTSERSIRQGTFSEVMGVPFSQFTKEYYYTWYNNRGPSTWVLVGNPSSSQTAYVDIYIGGAKHTDTKGFNGTYAIPPNGTVTPRFDLDEGPVRVVSVAGSGTPSAINVFTSERTLYGPSFNEMMGYPSDQLTTEYWFTWYDDVYMTSDILVGRP